MNKIAAKSRDISCWLAWCWFERERTYVGRCTGILYGGESEIVLMHHLPVELGGKKSTRSLVFSIVNAISYRHTDPLSLTSIYLLLLSGRSINSSSYMHLCLLSPLR